MGRAPLLLLLLWAALAAARPDRHLLATATPAIMRGKNATFDRFPWMVDVLTSAGRHMCGGSLIHPQVVMTAAHCFVDYNTGARSDWDPIVKIGQYAQTEPAQGTPPTLSYEIRKTVTTWVHRKYRTGTRFDYDIALLFLDEPSTKAVINLPGYIAKPQLPLPRYTSLMMLGWGDNGDPKNLNKDMDVLQEVFFREQPYLTCQQFYQMPGTSNFFTNTLMCAGNQPFYLEDTCLGDSGGALFMPGPPDVTTDDVAYGIWVGGLPCSLTRPQGAPGIYSSVATLRPWIDSSMACMLQQQCSAKMWGDLNVQGFDGQKFVQNAVRGQLLQLLNSPVFQMRSFTGTGSTPATLALATLGLIWEPEHIFILINRFGRMAVGINRGSGWVVVEPSTKKTVEVKLTSGWLRFYAPAACVSPPGSGTTRTTTTTTTTVIVNGSPNMVPGGLTQQLAGQQDPALDPTLAGRKLRSIGSNGGHAISADGSDVPLPEGLAEAMAAWEARDLAASLAASLDAAEEEEGEDGEEDASEAAARQLLNTRKRKPQPKRRKPKHKPKPKPKKRLANSVAQCSLRLQIRKPNFDLKVAQPWDTVKCQLRPWLEFSVTLTPAPVEYPLFGILGLTYPAYAV